VTATNCTNTVTSHRPTAASDHKRANARFSTRME